MRDFYDREGIGSATKRRVTFRHKSECYIRCYVIYFSINNLRLYCLIGTKHFSLEVLEYVALFMIPLPAVLPHENQNTLISLLQNSNLNYETYPIDPNRNSTRPNYSNLSFIIKTMRYETPSPAPVNMACCPVVEVHDFQSSLYTTCCALGCNKEVKRGEKCTCGQQN
ncbi:hypothetical protein IWW34DRAFT_296307 [Fusarium oxysporum f. sp. albedinis]|nr:hypothetical protein IWW34DRAFT_296307 [Fusarium oxysporum f. sp. albedinis]